MTASGEEPTQKGEISATFNFNKIINQGFALNEDAAATTVSKNESLKMIFVLKGTLKGFVDQAKKPVIVINEQQHNLICCSNELNWQTPNKANDMICLSIDFSFLAKYLPQDHDGIIGLKKGIAQAETATFSAQNLPINPEIIAVLQSLKTSTHTGFCERLFLESKVLELLMFQLSQFEQLNSALPIRPLKEEEMQKMQAVKAIITADIANQFTLRTLAHQVGTNEFNLKRNFKIAFGTTVYGYLNQHKMEMAKTMLIEKDLTVAEISAKMGYKYATHFSNAFKKYFGYLPNQLKSGKLALLIFVEEFAVFFENFTVFLV